MIQYSKLVLGEDLSVRAAGKWGGGAVELGPNVQLTLQHGAAKGASSPFWKHDVSP